MLKGAYQDDPIVRPEAPYTGGTGGYVAPSGSPVIGVAAASVAGASGVLNTGDFFVTCTDVDRWVQFPNYFVPVGAVVEIRLIVGAAAARVADMPVAGSGSYIAPGDAPRAFPMVNLAGYWAKFAAVGDTLAISIRQR